MSLYSNFSFNLYIVYELNNLPGKSTENCLLKICLFGTIKSVRKTIKTKFICNSRGIWFDGKCMCKFSNDFAKSVAIFGVDSTSSSHTDNWKKKLLVLGEGPTDDFNDSTGAAEK